MPCEIILEIAGFRQYAHAMHMLDEGRLCKGSSVTFCLEPDNEYDRDAVAIYAENNILIGYVKTRQGVLFQRYLNKAMIDAYIVQINGRKDKPVILVYVGFKPPIV